MKPITEFLNRHSLVAGVILMFMLTWPIFLSEAGLLPLDVPDAISILYGWGFIFASLIMTGLTLGRGAVAALLKRFLLWRVGWRWYLAALLLFPAIDVIAIGLNAVLTRTPPDFSTVYAYRIFGPVANLPTLILPFFLVDAITNGEEMGWRGYVLPRLQAKHSALVSSLVIGVVWGVWHLPRFLAPGNTSSFWLYVVDTTAKAVLYTWLYNNSKGSLLLVTLFHAVSNTAGQFLPIANTVAGENMGTLILVVLLEVIAAAAITVVEGPARLSRRLPAQIQAHMPGRSSWTEGQGAPGATGLT